MQINTLLLWEKRLEIEEQHRKEYRCQINNTEFSSNERLPLDDCNNFSGSAVQPNGNHTSPSCCCTMKGQLESRLD